MSFCIIVCCIILYCGKLYVVVLYMYNHACIFRAEVFQITIQTMSWTLQLSHASNGWTSVRVAHHKDHIEHAILGTKDQTNNGHRFHGANETNHVMLFGHQESQDGGTFLPTKKVVALHKRRGLCQLCQVMPEDTRHRLWARWGSGMKQQKWLWIHFHDTSFTYQYYTHTYAHKYCIYHIYRDHK